MLLVALWLCCMSGIVAVVSTCGVVAVEVLCISAFVCVFCVFWICGVAALLRIAVVGVSGFELSRFAFLVCAFVFFGVLGRGIVVFCDAAALSAVRVGVFVFVPNPSDATNCCVHIRGPTINPGPSNLHLPVAWGSAAGAAGPVVVKESRHTRTNRKAS